jgi:hypothetical protein
MQKVEATSILLKSFSDSTIRVNLSIYVTGSTLFLLFLVHFAIGSIISKLVFTTHNIFVKKMFDFVPWFHDPCYMER